MLSERTRGSLLKEIDLTKAQFLHLVDRARRLKHADDTGNAVPRLAGRNIALVFEKSSTRTRCAFEVAAHKEGAHVTYLDPSGSHLGKDESVPDTARVLGRMFDGIEFRGFSQNIVEQLAEYAGVPVWNGLTDQWHPTQMLADILTMTEHHDGPIEEIVYCYVGDGRNNVARSLLVTGALLGMDVRIVTPRELWPPEDVVEIAEHLAIESGARILLTDSVSDGVTDADFVYTDVWVSMGESDEQWASRVGLLTPYRVTASVMKLTGKPDSKFMHCLPSIHDRSTDAGQRVFAQFGLDGAEVTDEVFESAGSVVFDQAENRLHTIRAVLVAALGG
ncbi:ornithine carbamoyltransferase [Rhodococcus sp. G-MC3]|uniref:ornithine carbamoyltransferase n=1 Tax=Rhodococcus sp. G-MC3 TaxID=3046209 RepID=UPI003FA7961B